MEIAFLIGVFLFLAYTIAMSAMYGVPSSLSNTYYLLGEKPRGYLFTFCLWATAFLIAPLWLSVSENLTALVFLACGGLILVGSAPSFMSVDKGWHTAFALICAVASMSWQIASGSYIPIIGSLLMCLGIAILTKSLLYARIFWLEMTAFLSTFVSVGIKSV